MTANMNGLIRPEGIYQQMTGIVPPPTQRRLEARIGELEAEIGRLRQQIEDVQTQDEEYRGLLGESLELAMIAGHDRVHAGRPYDLTSALRQAEGGRA